MRQSRPIYHRHRYPAAVIACAVRWHFRFPLSLRDIKELLFERGVVVTCETIGDRFQMQVATHWVRAAARLKALAHQTSCYFGNTA